MDNVSARASIRIRKSPEAVFNAFADAREMSRFWFTRRDGILQQGKTSTWFLGDAPDAPSFDVLVTVVDAPHRLVIEWAHDEGRRTQVTWSLEADDNGETLVTIEETGFSGDADAMLARALDSTGGFNQVIVAAKALVEHGVALNVVADHA